MNLKQNKIKFLVIRFSSIGDIVLTSPVVRCLKNQVNNAEVHFLTRQGYASLLISNPNIDKVFCRQSKLKELIALLKEEQYDYLIDLQHNLISGYIKTLLGIPSYTFQKLNIKKFLMVSLKINLLPSVHIVDRYLATLSYFDVVNDGKGIDFFIDRTEEFDLKKYPVLLKNGYVAFVLAGTWSTKKLPAGKVIDICKRIDHPVILLGGKSEMGEAQIIESSLPGNIVCNFAGKITLGQSASLLRDANVVLTNDTGLMHIAAAFKKKIISFWGNTIPEFGMYPYMADICSSIIEVKGLRCRPCSKLGYRRCPAGHFRCMNINVEEVVNWVNKNYYD